MCNIFKSPDFDKYINNDKYNSDYLSLYLNVNIFAKILYM